MAERQSAKREPVHTVRLGDVSASIFENEADTKNGRRTFHSVSLQRRYVKDGETKYTPSFSGNELDTAIHALQQCKEWIGQHSPVVAG